MEKVIDFVHRRYPNTTIYVTENGELPFYLFFIYSEHAWSNLFLILLNFRIIYEGISMSVLMFVVFMKSLYDFTFAW